ncbi:MAG: hypothetical protein IJO93_05990, partial [Clostridia bacterium]|nr:hypothetical protein [Clostridia bacterium]
MNKTLPILSRLYGFDKFNTVCDTLQNGKGAVSVFGLSARVHMLASLYAATESSILLVSPNDNDCLKLEEQLRAYGVDAMHFPAKTQLLGASAMSVSGGTETGRVKNLVELLHAKKHFVLISAETLLQRLSPREALFDAVIRLECGMVCDMGELISSLSASGYERTELCTSACTFAVRGGRVDVFPSNSEYPVRIEFFGDEIDSLRSFDPEEQRSVDTLDSFSIYPATEVPCSDEKRAEL